MNTTALRAFVLYRKYRPDGSPWKDWLITKEQPFISRWGKAGNQWPSKKNWSDPNLTSKTLRDQRKIVGRLLKSKLDDGYKQIGKVIVDIGGNAQTGIDDINIHVKEDDHVVTDCHMGIYWDLLVARNTTTPSFKEANLWHVSWREIVQGVIDETRQMMPGYVGEIATKILLQESGSIPVEQDPDMTSAWRLLLLMAARERMAKAHGDDIAVNVVKDWPNWHTGSLTAPDIKMETVAVTTLHGEKHLFAKLGANLDSMDDDCPFKRATFMLGLSIPRPTFGNGKSFWF